MCAIRVLSISAIVLIARGGMLPAHATELFQVTSGPWDQRAPSWSPDGSRIVYASMSLSYTYDIMLVPSTGGEPSVLTSGGECEMRSPAWSADGAVIAFARAGRPDCWFDNQLDIWLVAATGPPGWTHLTSGPPSEFDPSWSPDGALIAFTGTLGSNSDLWLVPSMGGEPERLTFNPALEADPTWAPDGSSIAFRRRQTIKVALRSH